MKDESRSPRLRRQPADNGKKYATTALVFLMIIASSLLLLDDAWEISNSAETDETVDSVARVRDVVSSETATSEVVVDESVTRERIPESTPLLVYFSNAYSNDPSIGERDPVNIDRQLARFIDGAEVTIDAAFFELESARIVDALLSAAEKGVQVRLVLEDDYAGNPHVERLRRAHVPIVTDERSALMHNKFVIADGRRVWTGSVNATESGAWRNNNNGLEILSTEIAENYTAEFREMFEERLFGPRSPSRTPHTLVRIDDIGIYNYFAPEDDVQRKVLRFIRLAKTQIRFMAFSFTDDEIGSLLVQRHAEGVDVAGVIESRGSSLDYSELGRFREAGLPVLTDANRYLMHHKVIVIDSLWTITGSYNFSASANERNDENILIIRSRELATAMLDEYERVVAMEVE